MDNLADETQMSKQKEGCDGNTDVVWHTFGQPYYGLTLCIDTSGTSGGRQCQQATIQLNPSALNAANNPGSARNVTACHEVGHTGGLWHATPGHTDCMEVQNDPSGQNAHYDGHHEDHLNTN